MKVMETAWKDYATHVLVGVDPESVQYRETRKAFYAGAAALLDSMQRILGPGQEATESDLLIMDGIAGELRQFADDAARGRF